MNDAELRDKLASEYAVNKFPVQNIKTTNEFTQDVNFARRQSHNFAFQAGWDAARRHENKIVLKPETGGTYTVSAKIWTNAEIERDQLREAAEKLAKACEEASEWYQKDDVNGEAGEIAFKALTDYRKQFLTK